jgi:hypothetical protein
MPLLALQFQVLTEPQGKTSFSSPPTMAELLSACLPTEIEPCTPARVVAGSQAQGAVHFRCDDVNFVSLGILGGGGPGFDPDQLVYPTGVAIDIKAPWVQVVEFQGRYFLRNGYHRAYQLMLAGATHIPCITLKATDYMRDVDLGGTLRFDPPLMLGPNPPTCAHYGCGRAYDVPLRKFSRGVTVTWSEVAIPDE